MNEPEFPLPTTSTIQEFAVAVLMLVEIESAPLVSTLVATDCGAPWFTPVSETAPAEMPSTAPCMVTFTVPDPAAPSPAFSR